MYIVEIQLYLAIDWLSVNEEDDVSTVQIFQAPLLVLHLLKENSLEFQIQTIPN